MPKLRSLIVIACILVKPVFALAQANDKDQLGRAIEYFQASKYHESMLILKQLDDKYNLNPRFRAFLGVCYYYESEYTKAANLLETTIPKLTAFSPQEQGLYNWLCGESLFWLCQWQKAIGYYEASTLTRNGNEKADAFYRIGFCYINLNNMREAKDYLESALIYYKISNSSEYKARIAQLQNMTLALKKRFGEE